MAEAIEGRKMDTAYMLELDIKKLNKDVLAVGACTADAIHDLANKTQKVTAGLDKRLSSLESAKGCDCSKPVLTITESEHRRLVRLHSHLMEVEPDPSSEIFGIEDILEMTILRIIKEVKVEG